MAKEFKVAYLGVKTFTDPSVETVWNNHLGIYVYTLPAEKILHIVENVGCRGLSDIQCGIKPVFEYGEMMGGRFYPTVEPKQIAKAIEDVDVLIVSGLVYYLYVLQFLTYLSEHDFTNCIVVLRMPLSADEARFTQDLPASRWLDTFTTSSSTTSGRGRWKRKSKKKPQALQTIVIGDLKHGGMEMDTGLNELKNALRRDELTTAIVTPMKETVTAGKSLVQIGQSFANWVSKLVGAQ